MADEQIIQLDVGYKRVKAEGIDPFVRFIETGEREFFKAKEFVTLYDLIFKMSARTSPRLHLTPRPAYTPACTRTSPLLARSCH